MTSLDNPIPRPRVDGERVADLCRQLLEAVGEDPQREGLQGTPERFARWWTEFLDHDPGRTDTVFEEDLPAGTDRVVIVRVLYELDGAGVVLLRQLDNGRRVDAPSYESI